MTFTDMGGQNSLVLHRTMDYMYLFGTDPKCDTNTRKKGKQGKDLHDLGRFQDVTALGQISETECVNCGEVSVGCLANSDLYMHLHSENKKRFRKREKEEKNGTSRIQKFVAIYTSFIQLII